MQHHKPDRLNLAIARRCFVACKGCYSFFGNNEPDLPALAKSVETFVHLGIDAVTISGGDPLTIKGLVEFLAAIRSLGVRSIKVDTVGTNLLTLKPSVTAGSTLETKRYLDTLNEAVDYLGIPLDGWSNSSVSLFRVGRPLLFDETVELLKTIDSLGVPPNIIINTVAHKHNLYGLTLILDEVISHRSVCHWNIFQYTPTDQAAKGANEFFEISMKQFAQARTTLFPAIDHLTSRETLLTIDFRTIESRLGEYLLINSDGAVWVPDENGRTIYMGTVFGREQVILERWSDWVDSFLNNVGKLADVGSWEYVVQSCRPVGGC